jgi:Spy/CpxP family protein refolding chaperone
VSRALQWKLIAGFVLVFVAGGMTGAFFGAWHAHHFFLEGHEPGMVATRMKERLRAELNLTPEQVNKISPIVEKMASDLEQIRRETGRRVHETFQQAHNEMAASLTDEQKRKLKQMERRHRSWPGFHGHGSPKPPGEQPEP